MTRGQAETASHLFLYCGMYAPLWQMVRCLRGLKACRSFLQLLWLLCVWLIWQKRNNKLFKNSQLTISELIDKVKFYSYWWLKANNTSFVFGSQRWWSEPLRCLGIG
ncbi:transmembrane protein, putative [Medicago truncatula]|uniref:Transmembrane protein, putative n=1 Tax=Medicago truncatula TaxID=3880 RepID=A0A072UZ81_MEDTR|nr:transmembrane protein, putative [Medicago truncatula]